MEALNRNLTNEELVALVKKDLESGMLIIVDKLETSNPEYTMLYVAQVVSDLPNGVDVTKFEAEALGWDNTLIMRAMFNAKTDISEKYPKGTKIKGARIRVFDSFTPEFDEQSPRLTREKDGVRVLQGAPIYRHTRVVFDEEFEDLGGHSVIEYDQTVPIGELKKLQDKGEQSVVSAKALLDDLPITT
jgi:hypothetical protein